LAVLSDNVEPPIETVNHGRILAGAVEGERLCFDDQILGLRLGGDSPLYPQFMIVGAQKFPPLHGLQHCGKYMIIFIQSQSIVVLTASGAGLHGGCGA
jgi:hypothetical protein